VIDVREASGQIAALLQTIPPEKMAGYPDGEVPENPPTPPNDPRVLAYWVLFAGVGGATPVSIAAWPLVTTLRFGVTVAGGTKDRVLNGVELVRKAISGKVIASGLISEALDPGSVLIDRNETPHRHFVPMQFLLEP
jgi:hypothetical protein